MIEQWPATSFVYNEHFWRQIYRPLDTYKPISMTRLSMRAAQYVPNLAFLRKAKSCDAKRMYLIHVGRMPSIDEEVTEKVSDISLYPVEPKDSVQRQVNRNAEATTQTLDEIASQKAVNVEKSVTSKKLKMD